MALELKKNYNSIAPNIHTPFVAIGGTGPYVYSVVAGGVGGQIDSDGIYIAPQVTGIDTIRVVDSLSEEATTTINILDQLSLVCEVISHELNYDQDQVYIYNQNFNIPKDTRTYVAIGIGSCKVVANTSNKEMIDGSYVEVQTANMNINLEMNILSKGRSAFFDKDKVVMALNSLYSQQIQEANNFNIAKIPNVMSNISGVEGPAIETRYNINIKINYTVKKVEEVAYFDTFQDPELFTNK